MKAINVERDKYGMWTHPDLPVWGENTSPEQAEAWFASKGLTHHLVLMDGELGERWGKGELESCAEWQPEPRAKDSFLVGIWDSEDGVVAMFASPAPVQVAALPRDLVDAIHDCGVEIEDVQHLIKKAQSIAVMHFVNIQIGAFESGFIQKSDLTLFDLYQFAKQHVLDNHGEIVPAFSDVWGINMIQHCSGGENNIIKTIEKYHTKES